VSSFDEAHGDRTTAADTIAGLLAVGSIVLSGIAMGFGLLLQLEAHPARLAPVAIVVALVAARMSARHQSLALKAALFGAFAWVVGMVVAIVTDGPLF
jgi:FtsH-binding integral membrane protein